MSTTAQPTPAPIFNVDAQSFASEVLEASHETPILVDFWAEWCAPCKALGPVLENVVQSSDGRVRLAKIDIDSNQQFAGSQGIRSIPTVRLFLGGAAIAEFMGAQPEQAIRAFLDQHLPTAPQGQAPEGPNARQQIELLLREGQFEQATQSLEQLPEPERGAFAARIELATQANDLPAIGELQSRVSNDSADFNSRLALSTRQAASGDYDNAMEGLLLILSRERNFADGAARKNILKIFDAMGADDQRVKHFRAMLANVLN